MENGLSPLAVGRLEQWDSATTPTELMLKAEHPAGGIAAAGTAKTLDATDYTLDRTKDLIIAFDINSTGGNGNARRENVVG
ncbi:MAG: hypothetical protein ACREXR_15045, partial [Gammaproteobacteria bacterium]